MDLDEMSGGRMILGLGSGIKVDERRLVRSSIRTAFGGKDERVRGID
jgi:alkanesulfonate monooxygenase SsuD/methylene tetrahydromethanopterin reductase-like flavin-dependent oxidoreductase (luciferase family)